MMLFAAKCALMSHWSLTKSTVGVPHVLGDMPPAPPDTSAGTFGSLRPQNQTEIVLCVRSIAYQPPPALLNEGP